MEQRLELKMIQKLILTPQLQQAIKLLQLPQLELVQTLNQELIENPLLEETSEETATDDELAERPEEDERAPEAENFEDPDDTEASLEKLMGYTVGEYFNNRSYDGRDLGYFTPDSNPTQTLEHYVSESSDLYGHLMWQLRLCNVPLDIMEPAEAVIGNINDNGYLDVSAEEIASFTDCTEETARRAIAMVQTLDPTGIGARDLSECLALQLGPLDLKGTLVEHLVMEDLEALQKRKYQQLASKYGCSMEELKEALKVISNLEPKPGRGISSAQPVYIKPDVFIIKADDDFKVVLNDDSVPTLRINNYYKKLLRNKASLQKDEKEFLNEKFRSAVWLLKSLDHRNKTIYRVSECILEFQQEFFETGVAQLKPLNLKDVAAELGMHESTISRATSNKYLSCSHGLFNFRFFFSSGIKSGTGTVSSTAVKEMIKKLINEEDPSKPLSDNRISEMLASLNIKIARRTVAKYREDIRIPSQSMRKNIA